MKLVAFAKRHMTLAVKPLCSFELFDCLDALMSNDTNNDRLAWNNLLESFRLLLDFFLRDFVIFFVSKWWQNKTHVFSWVPFFLFRRLFGGFYWCCSVLWLKRSTYVFKQKKVHLLNILVWHTVTKHFRYLKWRNPHLYINCMDMAYLRQNPTGYKGTTPRLPNTCPNTSVWKPRVHEPHL